MLSSHFIMPTLPCLLQRLILLHVFGWIANGCSPPVTVEPTSTTISSSGTSPGGVYMTKYLMSSYAPPTAWTYPISGAASNGQSPNAEVAKAEIKRTVDDSVSRALAGMNLDADELPTYDIMPLQGRVLIEAPSVGLTDPKWYLTRAGTVLFECIQATDGKSDCEPLQLNGSISVTTRYPLSEQQKKQLGALLTDQLTDRKLFLPNQLIPF